MPKKKNSKDELEYDRLTRWNACQLLMKRINQSNADTEKIIELACLGNESFDEFAEQIFV